MVKVSIIIFMETFGYFLFSPDLKSPLLYCYKKILRMLRNLPWFTQLFVDSFRGLYFLRKPIIYGRVFLHSSRCVVQPTQHTRNCLFSAIRSQNWVSVNWGRRTYWMRRQRVATDCWIFNSAFYPIKWWGKWFDYVGNVFCLGWLEVYIVEFEFPCTYCKCFRSYLCRDVCLTLSFKNMRPIELCFKCLLMRYRD